MGRKSISGERKTDKPLRIRLTADERARLDAAAGGKATSTWARDILLSMAPPIVADPPKPTRRTKPPAPPKSPRRG